ncbi:MULTISPECIES: MATE family efflux transporter [Psychrilyobacter]|uniref:Multidrug-efflux transporter n=1 Tax=Psychrilyobacter piezotolerans TaxID=2293438 RepID=A0ABX9KG30_9FUSO|nr:MULTISPECIES: MATE family efflux transporter [Psychrilyobacter]MCS5421378.1 MATE family efflux transporter [Psychrilyobacter sp. S5]NDI78464.1 MATE family efflux transporter [Psychrilyobacter piezotolerans]RDE60649.1 MATE family efflux transporter [Psychrilyobacter sp. S5]REI40576.1 MATE family efflux transporter [Psychrilyobacter piezotolerans]
MKEKLQSVKIITALAIPAILENTMQISVGFIDTFFIGKLGTEALAGVSASNSIMNIYIAFFLAVSVGCSALMTRNIGMKDYKNTNNILHQSINLAIGIGFLSGLINVIFAKPLLSLLGLSSNVIKITLPYFWAVGTPSVLISISMILSSALRSNKDTKTPMKVGFIVNIINTILNYFLIFGLGNWNGLGLLGAGIATSIARTLGVILLWKSLTVSKNSNTDKSSSDIIITKNKLFKLNWDIIKNISIISVPAAMEKLIMRTGQLIYISMIISISEATYAAHNIAGVIESFTYLPAMGFGVVAATLVGQQLGEGDVKSAKESGILCYIMAVVFMSIVGAVIFIFAPYLTSIFSEDPAIIRDGSKALRIIAFVQPTLAATFVITSALQGAGDTKYPMYITFIGIWFIRVTGIYILGIKLNMGITGVWLAIAADIVIRGTLLILRFITGKSLTETNINYIK